MRLRSICLAICWLSLRLSDVDQNEICRHSTFGWLLAGLTLHQIICFIFSILDRCLDRLPANVVRACLRGITDGQQSVYLLVRGHRWPAIFLPGCLASILCMVSLEIRQYVSCCVLSRIPQLLVESAPGLASECSKLCESPELLNYVCRVWCIRASLFRNPLSGQVPQCLPHLHQSACKNPTLY